MDLLLKSYDFGTDRELNQLITTLNLKIEILNAKTNQRNNLSSYRKLALRRTGNIINTLEGEIISLFQKIKQRKINIVKYNEQKRLENLSQTEKMLEDNAEELIMKQIEFKKSFDEATLISEKIAKEFEVARISFEEKNKRAANKQQRSKTLADQRNADKTVAKARKRKDQADKLKATLDFASFREAVKAEDLLIQEVLADEAVRKIGRIETRVLLAEIAKFEAIQAFALEDVKNSSSLSPKKNRFSSTIPQDIRSILQREVEQKTLALNLELDRLKRLTARDNYETIMEAAEKDDREKRFASVEMMLVETNKKPLLSFGLSKSQRDAKACYSTLAEAAMKSNKEKLYADYVSRKDFIIERIEQLKNALISEAQRVLSLTSSSKQLEIARKDAIERERKEFDLEKRLSLEAKEAARIYKRAVDYIPLTKRRHDKAVLELKKLRESEKISKKVRRLVNVGALVATAAGGGLAQAAHVITAGVGVIEQTVLYLAEKKERDTRNECLRAEAEVPRLFPLMKEAYEKAATQSEKAHHTQFLADIASFHVPIEIRQILYHITELEIQKYETLKQIFEQELIVLQGIMMDAEKQKYSFSIFNLIRKAEANKLYEIAYNNVRKGQRIVDAINKRLKKLSIALETERNRELRLQNGLPIENIFDASIWNLPTSNNEDNNHHKKGKKHEHGEKKKRMKNTNPQSIPMKPSTQKTTTYKIQISNDHSHSNPSNSNNNIDNQNSHDNTNQTMNRTSHNDHAQQDSLNHSDEKPKEDNNHQNTYGGDDGNDDNNNGEYNDSIGNESEDVSDEEDFQDCVEYDDGIDAGDDDSCFND